jgi:hypothetical protein
MFQVYLAYFEGDKIVALRKVQLNLLQYIILRIKTLFNKEVKIW